MKPIFESVSKRLILALFLAVLLSISLSTLKRSVVHAQLLKTMGQEIALNESISIVVPSGCHYGISDDSETVHCQDGSHLVFTTESRPFQKGGEVLQIGSIPLSVIAADAAGCRIELALTDRTALTLKLKAGTQHRSCLKFVRKATPPPLRRLLLVERQKGE